MQIFTDWIDFQVPHSSVWMLRTLVFVRWGLRVLAVFIFQFSLLLCKILWCFQNFIHVGFCWENVNVTVFKKIQYSIFISPLTYIYSDPRNVNTLFLRIITCDYSLNVKNYCILKVYHSKWNAAHIDKKPSKPKNSGYFIYPP